MSKTDSKNGIRIWQVDAFASRAFEGNPAAVCILEQYPSDDWLQDVASEMNLSETAFLVPTEKATQFRLRWFTPAAEVDLCGHATLASAHTLYETVPALAGQSISFETRSGTLVCEKREAGIVMDFPADDEIKPASEAVRTQVANALGVPLAEAWQAKFDTMAVLADSKTLRTLSPDFHALAQIETRGVIVTSKSDTRDYDFLSRFFAPQHNINEDPVTGSAHCSLAPFWAKRLEKLNLVGFQASPRGGVVGCEVVGDRIRLTGSALTVLEGRLLVAPQ